MPWSKENSIPSLSNKSDEVKEVFALAANAALSKGMSEEEAIFAGLGAVKRYEQKHSVRKAIIPKQEIPSHLKAVLDAKIQKQSQITEQPRNTIRKEFLGKNAITADSERSLVSASWDGQGRLILMFDDGQQIITDPVPVSEYIEQHVGVTVQQVSGGGFGFTLDELDNVQASAPQNGQVLTWSSASNSWIASDATVDGGTFD